MSGSIEQIDIRPSMRRLPVDDFLEMMEKNLPIE